MIESEFTLLTQFSQPQSEQICSNFGFDIKDDDQNKNNKILGTCHDLCLPNGYFAQYTCMCYNYDHGKMCNDYGHHHYDNDYDYNENDHNLKNNSKESYLKIEHLSSSLSSDFKSIEEIRDLFDIEVNNTNTNKSITDIRNDSQQFDFVDHDDQKIQNKLELQDDIYNQPNLQNEEKNQTITMETTEAETETIKLQNLLLNLTSFFVSYFLNIFYHQQQQKQHSQWINRSMDHKNRNWSSLSFSTHIGSIVLLIIVVVTIIVLLSSIVFLISIIIKRLIKLIKGSKEIETSGRKPIK